MALRWGQHTLWGNYTYSAAAPSSTVHGSPFWPCSFGLAWRSIPHTSDRSPVQQGMVGEVGCLTVVAVVLHQSYFQSNVRDHICSKLTWLVLGGDPVARSHRVEQFTAL